MKTHHSYSLNELNNLLFENNSFIVNVLPKNVKETIQYLESYMEQNIAPDEMKNTFQDVKYEKYEQIRPHYNKDKDKKQTQNGLKKKINYDENWKHIAPAPATTPTPTFKTTQINMKEGVEKDFNEIRMSLNKISAKNFITQKNCILEKISSFLLKQETEESSSAGFLKITQSIFDVACNNKFFSELYADLYLELSNQHPLFLQIVNEHILKYKNTIYDILYVDPNVNYDEYCNYNKKNDMRKSCSTFFVMLLKKNILQEEQIIDIIQFYFELFFKYVDEPNKLNEVEEITENLFILISLGKPFLQKHILWNDLVILNVKNTSKMKSQEHVSLSNRAIFKFFDLVGLL